MGGGEAGGAEEVEAESCGVENRSKGRVPRSGGGGGQSVFKKEQLYWSQGPLAGGAEGLGREVVSPTGKARRFSWPKGTSSI